MIRNYFKLAWRNLVKHKAFSAVNILGLTVGIATSIIIINYVIYEFNYDTFNKKKDRIYRVESKFYEGQHLTDDWATSAFGYGSAIKKEIPGVEEVVRIPLNQSEKVVRYKDVKIRENTITYTEPSFFKVFDYKLIEGDQQNALAQPNTVVITQKAAKKFFANENPIGKRLVFASGNNTLDCEVTGLLEDFPSNSHIHFDYLISYQSLPEWMRDFWYMHEIYTYVLLQPGIKPGAIEHGFANIAEKYKTDEALKNKRWEISLAPLTDIHLAKQKTHERETKGSKSVLITLLIMAIVILISAWINYVNLTTARSVERAKEVGIRKVVGAQKAQLIRQFLMESWLVNAFALLLAFAIIYFAYPLFNRFAGREVGFFIFEKPIYAVLFALLIIAGISVSGFYPAFILSGIKPSQILKGKFSHSKHGAYLQKGLVIFQFAAALFLITCIFIIQKQIRFMHHENLAVDIDRTVVMKYPVSNTKLDSTVQLFADKIRNLPNVKAATVAGSVPGMETAMFASNALDGTLKRENKLYDMLTVDYDYIKMFGLQMIAGRPFSKDYGDEKNKLLINEAALQRLGISKAADAIGKRVWLEGDKNTVEIIGVVKNWHQQGLNTDFTPLMLIMNGKIDWVPPRFIAVKINDANLSTAMETLKANWQVYFPESSYDAFFLDSYFNEQYKAEQKFGSVVSLFTIIAFLISLMGLWALSAYTANSKVREVGIRKVYGASVLNVLSVLSKNILVLVAIAFLIAVPLSYIVMSRWLNNFPFRTNIDAGIYLIGGAVTVVVSVFTVVWQSWKVVNQSPVKSLRSE